MALTANNVTTDQVSGSVGERNAETRSYHTSSAVIAALKERSKKSKLKWHLNPSAKFRAETNLNLRGSSITSLSSTSIVVCMLRFGTAIARLRAHQLDAYEGRACQEANLARGRQPVPIVDVDRCLHEKAFIVWFMAEEIRSGDQPLRAATVLWFRPPPLNRDSIRCAK